MTFTKTSQKFGQWSDVRANTVYGLGFSSEAELNKVSSRSPDKSQLSGRILRKFSIPTIIRNNSHLSSRIPGEFFLSHQGDSIFCIQKAMPCRSLELLEA